MIAIEYERPDTDNGMGRITRERSDMTNEKYLEAWDYDHSKGTRVHRVVIPWERVIALHRDGDVGGSL
jgi:hypothetical protein